MQVALKYNNTHVANIVGLKSYKVHSVTILLSTKCHINMCLKYDPLILCISHYIVLSQSTGDVS